MINFYCKLLALATVSLFSGLDIDVGPMVLRPFDLIMFICLLGWVVLGPVSSKHRISVRLLSDRVLVVYIFFRLYVVINGYVLSGPSVAIKEMIQAVEFYVYIVFLANFLSSKEMRGYFFRYLFIGLGFICAGTVLWHIANGHYISYKELNEPKLAFGLFGVMAYCNYINPWLKTKYVSGLLGSSVLMMLLSSERKGWVGLLGVFICSFFLSSSNSRSRLQSGGKFVKLITIIALTIPIFLVSLQSERVREQVSSLVEVVGALYGEADYTVASTRSNQARLFLMEFASDSFRENPIVGIGTDKFKSMIRLIAPEDYLVHGAHNEYQRILVENGLVGEVLFLMMLLIVGKRLLKYQKKISDEHKHLVHLTTEIFIYGSIVNFFLGGGALNLLFYAMPMGIILSYKREADSLVPKALHYQPAYR